MSQPKPQLKLGRDYYLAKITLYDDEGHLGEVEEYMVIEDNINKTGDFITLFQYNGTVLGIATGDVARLEYVKMREFVENRAKETEKQKNSKIQLVGPAEPGESRN